METIWIIGVGQFGSMAAKRLSRQHRDWSFVLVDPVVDPEMENQLMVNGANVTFEQSDGIQFLNDHLKPGSQVSWIIPCLPLHLAWEFCRMKLGPDRVVKKKLSSHIDQYLKNPVHGPDGNVYVSNADFICPANCSEPGDICTITKAPRKQDMFNRLAALNYKNMTPVVLRSRQLGPGIGGYSPDELFSLLKKIEQHPKGLLLLCTACRCHGVITGVDRL